jgi:signal transduction histidine kinase
MPGALDRYVQPHLTDNAIRHNAKTVRLKAIEEAGSVRMTVSNDGDPISEPNREKIFDAFFTTAATPAARAWDSRSSRP